MSGLLQLLIITGIIVGWLELSHRFRPSSPLRLQTFDWTVSKTSTGLKAIGWIEIINPHKRMEIMVPELEVKPVLLGKEKVREIEIKTHVITYHPDEESRLDGYWQAYILKSEKNTRAQIIIELEEQGSVDAIKSVENIWVDFNWISYGPFGRIRSKQGAVIPIKKPNTLSPDKAYFKQYKDCQVLPIKTHLLGPLDDIVDVVSTYASQIVRPGDILTIGETPIAIMQGRYIHPSTVKPGFLARLLCHAFHPTSSLATACGLQTLVDISGPSRVLISFLIGTLGRLLFIRGIFYRLAGNQARLIDDITGTTPPYDQTIVLGPESPRDLCEKVSSHLGIDVAIVDVNDLGRVKILATSRKCKKSYLHKALRTNPAGNANEQTPLVLVRP